MNDSAICLGRDMDCGRSLPCPDHPTVADRVRKTIAALELDNADAVADRLRALEVKGRRYSKRCCPVANLIKRVDGVNFVMVDGIGVHLIWPGDRGKLYDPDHLFTLPNVVSEFVIRFDQGVYLDLVEVPGGEAR